jgi:UDP-N-acetylmuramoylalanine--D-glutamate ligase
MILKDLKNEKILILGLGKEGANTYIFLRKLLPQKKLGLADQLPYKNLSKKIQKLIREDKKTRLHLGKNYLAAIRHYEVVIKAPGISPFLPQLQKAKAKITSQTEIFFNNCPGTIIGITGTKGKTTATSLIHRVLRQGGLKTRLVGNIGRPGLLLLEKAKKETIFVYELSSHQLFGLKKSPQIAVFLNIFPEHGDYYPSFDKYLKAKENIAIHQSQANYFIYNSSLSLLDKVAVKSPAKKLPFGLRARKNSVCFAKDGYLVWRKNQKEEKIIKTSQVPVLGKFNLLNVMPAIIVGKLFKIPSKNITDAIKNFKPLKHRLEYIGRYKGVSFYNDSISTIPESTIAALDALRPNVQSLILGGFERRQNFKKLAKRILRSNIKTLILFPDTGKRIWKEISSQKSRQQALPKHFFVKSMKEAIKLAYKHTQKGKICLLSPASPSFNLFKDYRQRGNLFKKYIEFHAGK